MGAGCHLSKFKGEYRKINLIFLLFPIVLLQNSLLTKKTIIFTRISCTKSTNCQLSCTTNASGLHAKYKRGVPSAVVDLFLKTVYCVVLQYFKYLATL